MEQETLKKVDYKRVFWALWRHRKKFYITLPITFVLACAIILCVPHSYTSSTKLAPEYDLQGMNSLNSIASSFGIDLGDNPSADAISPTLYPDVIESNEFLCRLAEVEVENLDGTLRCSTYEYFEKEWKQPWWKMIYFRSIRFFQSLFKSKALYSISDGLNPLRLNAVQTGVIELMRENITCKTDKKNYVITISVSAQDPLIATILTDSITTLLQKSIIEYRTNKARMDVAYYTSMCEQKRAQWEKAREAYSTYADAHQGSGLQEFRTRTQQLEDNLNLQLTAYRIAQNQLQAAEAKLQERTPAFSTLQGASLPIKPSKPRRKLFVLGMLVLVTCVLGTWCLRDILLNVYE